VKRLRRRYAERVGQKSLRELFADGEDMDASSSLCSLSSPSTPALHLHGCRLDRVIIQEIHHAYLL